MSFSLEVDTEKFNELVIDATHKTVNARTGETREQIHEISLSIGKVSLHEGYFGESIYRYGEMIFNRDLSLVGATSHPNVEIYFSLEGLYQSQVHEHTSSFSLHAHRFSISYSPNPGGKCMMLENMKNGFFELNLSKEDIMKLNLTSSRTYDRLVAALMDEKPFAVSYKGIPLEWSMVKILSQIKDPRVNDSFRPYYRSIKVQELMILLLQQCDAYNPGATKKLTMIDHQRLTAVVDYLRSNYNAFPTLEEVAKVSGCCTSKLTVDFKKVYNCSVFQYCQMLRMDEAARHLKQGELPISSVAYMAGYQNPQHFTAAFKRHFGVLPKYFRKGGTSW
ncbi:MAG: AraC family transcriptional regulator [Cytophagales bacterium]|nr:AraC family transcriptional regulator [Cytophagales bacterium]